MTPRRDISRTWDQRPTFPLPLAVAALLVCAALVALQVGARPAPVVTVDGARHGFAAGTTVGELAASGLTSAKPGTLYSVNGGIISLHGGSPVRITRNGVEAEPGDPVFDGDVVSSVSGRDRTERAFTATISVDPTATVRGSGPIIKVLRLGEPGVAVVRRGELSGEIVSTRVVKPAVGIILEASQPTSKDKVVALTFDDGPWPGQTEKILAILKANDVPGTFFELGQQIARYPKLTAAVVAEGSAVGNHSWSHPFLTRLKPALIRKQITSTRAAIRSASGTDTSLFRPPYGDINHTVWDQARITGVKLVLWDVDTLDWTRPGPAKIVANAMREVRQSSIILMHDGGGDRSQTIAALPMLITQLKQRGYSFATVSQIEATR